MAENDCIFCKVASGEMQGNLVYKDSSCVAFNDINPQAPKHLLIIPREHIASLDDVARNDEQLLGHMLRIASKVAYEQGLSDSGYRTVINTGEGAGQSVFHLHIHVLGGRPLSWPPG
jgi:histidine triad (HIT) family protein